MAHRRSLQRRSRFGSQSVGWLLVLVAWAALASAARAQLLDEFLFCSTFQGPTASAQVPALPEGLRLVAPRPEAVADPAALSAQTPFQFVLRFGDVLPKFVLLDTADRADAAIGFEPNNPPPGVIIDKVAGTISFSVQAAGPWFIQTSYQGDGQTVLTYRVLSGATSIVAGQPRLVDISRALATRAVTFAPVDAQGAPIARVPFDIRAPLLVRFTHRATGLGCASLLGGFGQGARIMVSDTTADYSLAAIAAVGRRLGRSIHLYQYLFRNGIRSDLNLANNAAQLVQKSLTVYPGVSTPGVTVAPGLGYIDYSQARGPTFQARIDTFFAADSFGVGQPASLFVLSLGDSVVSLDDPAEAQRPDFPVFLLSGAATNSTVGADSKIAFTSPSFTGTGDYAQSFFFVDPNRGTFDRPSVPANGQITLGSNPLLDATRLAQSCDDFAVRVVAQHQVQSCFVEGGAPILECAVSALAADGSNQGSAQDLAAGFTPTLKLKRGDALVFQGLLKTAAVTPLLFQAPVPSPGNYRLVITNPGTNIGGTPFPVRSKSFFRLRAGVDGNPPALTKLQLLDAGALVNAITPGTVRDVLRFRIDPVAGAAGCTPLRDSLTATTAEASVDGGAFQALTVSSLPSGDLEARLPAAGNAARFDLKLSATDSAGNRLVTRFSLGVGSRGPGPAAIPDTAFTTSPASTAFNLPQGSGTQTASVSLGSAGEPIDFTVSESLPWLTVSAASVVTPTTLILTASAAGLAPGTYQGTVTIAGEDAGVAATLLYPVSLTVTGAQGSNLTVSPTALSFAANAGGPNPASRTLTLGTTGSALAVTTSDNASWLTVSPASTTTPATLTAAVNVAGLAAGSYSAVITLTAAGAGNSPVVVPVSLTLSAPPPTAGLTVSPGSLSFSAPQGGPAPPPQVLAIGSSGAALSWTASDNAAFVGESPASGVTPGATNVSVNVGGLAAGTYNAVITVSSPTGGSVGVPVSLTVTAVNAAAPVVNGFNPPSGPVGTGVEVLGANFTAASAVSFNFVAASSVQLLANGNLLAVVPPGATTGFIRVSNAAGTGVSFQPFTVISGNAPAISGFSPLSGAAGDRITITGANFQNPSQVFFNGKPSPFVLFGGTNFLSAEVPAGASSGPLTVTTGGGSATSSASFTVTGSPPPTAPAVTATPVSLSFNGTQGGSNPPGQAMGIGSTGDALGWSATSTASWLSLVPASGTTPSNTTANVNLAGLAAGTYNANLTIAAPGATSALVAVSLSVGPANPPPSGGPVITLTSPNSGTFRGGSLVTIQWSSSSATSHRVEFSLDGVTFQPIATGLAGTQMSTTWRVPSTLVGQGEISPLTLRVIARNDTTGATAQDTNDGLLTLLGPF